MRINIAVNLVLCIHAQMYTGYTEILFIFEQ